MRDIPPGKLTGAQQRARREQAENEARRRQAAEAAKRRLQVENQQRLRQQAQDYQADLNRAESEARRPQQPARRQERPPEREERFYGARPERPPARRSAYPSRQERPELRESDPDHTPQAEERPQKVRSRWFTAMVMVASTLAACVFISLFLVQSVFDLFGLGQEYYPISVSIPQGAGVSDVVRILGQEGVVSHPLTFRFYLNFRAVQDEYLLPGDYVFNSQMSYDEIIRALMTGRTTREVVRLTFREGLSLWEIALMLEESRVVNAEAFIEYLNTAEFPFEFFGEIERSPLRFHILEGYLFPDTYDFYVGENVRSVAMKFLRNFSDRVMTPQLLSQMEARGLTIDETITFASIIQREAALADDMRIVSSVFHNRLNSPNFPHLESDVTTHYIMDKIRPRFELLGIPANEELIAAYNTYIAQGLPIGPVNNPGMDAIMAVLNPEHTDVAFFFFVTDELGDFRYAVTYAQHQANIALALAVGDEVRGTGMQYGQ